MNNDQNAKIRSFTDLNAWKEGHKLVLLIYKITANFPKSETYSIVDQMRRAAASITANLAEGFTRQYYREKIQFYYLSKGSLVELKNFLLISKDVSYLTEIEFKQLMDQADSVDQLIQGFIRKSRTFLK
ncbi:MAG TPA: four helix bundle protein [Patescibacteria group bacterium]|nr:four helix bundle protein [Patescibacteria group bacterium]